MLGGPVVSFINDFYAWICVENEISSTLNGILRKKVWQFFFCGCGLVLRETRLKNEHSLNDVSLFSISQNKGKESENSYRKLKSSRWTGTRTYTRKQNQNILILFPCVFVCLSTVNSSIFGKNSHFPFLYFVLFVLWYFCFHVVYLVFHFEKFSNHSHRNIFVL